MEEKGACGGWRAVFLGPPGSGKGTQAKQLAEAVNAKHLSTGDLFREAVQAETELGRQVEGYLSRGELVPDEIVCQVLSDRLERMRLAGECGFLLDGFPRTLSQAQALDEITGRLGLSLTDVVLLDANEEEIVGRLSGRLVCERCGAPYHRHNKPPKQEGICDLCGGRVVQREDDREEIVRQRLEVYRKQTAPLIEYYAKKGLLKVVDGTGRPEKVHERVLRAVGVTLFKSDD